MKRFYCTVKKGQVIVESDTTIIDTDDRVINFFAPTPEGYRKAYKIDGLPFNELIPLPTEAELAKQAQTVINQEARTYLASTDWYIIRLQESGTAIPAEILTLRAEARLKVVV